MRFDLIGLSADYVIARENATNMHNLYRVDLDPFAPIESEQNMVEKIDRARSLATYSTTSADRECILIFAYDTYADEMRERDAASQ